MSLVRRCWGPRWPPPPRRHSRKCAPNDPGRRESKFPSRCRVPIRPTRICNSSIRSARGTSTSGHRAMPLITKTLSRLKNKVETAGLLVWNIGNIDVHNMEEVTLNLPGRDKKIEQYKNYLRNVGARASITPRMPTWGTASGARRPRRARGGARARVFNLSSATGYWAGKEFTGPLTHGRVYTEKEIWDNYEYFIRQVAPGRGGAGSVHRASTRTIRRCRCWAACRAASSAISKATSARWKSPTARTWASASAAGPGSRAGN